MIITLTWISIITGGILILLMLISLLVGTETDVEISDGDIDTGGIGYIKGGLTFLSVASWVVKIVIQTETPLYLALISGLLAGGAAVFFLRKRCLTNAFEIAFSNPERSMGFARYLNT